jgi:hypothetical protein
LPNSSSQFAAAAESRIDRQHATVADRRLQQQLTQIAGKDLDRMQLGPFRQLATHFALQAGGQQAVQRIP